MELLLAFALFGYLKSLAKTGFLGTEVLKKASRKVSCKAPHGVYVVEANHALPCAFSRFGLFKCVKIQCLHVVAYIFDSAEDECSGAF